jgi:hypothetical protein
VSEEPDSQNQMAGRLIIVPTVVGPIVRTVIRPVIGTIVRAVIGAIIAISTAVIWIVRPAIIGAAIISIIMDLFERRSV